MENQPLHMNHRCALCGKVTDKSKFLSWHLNSEIHKQKMEEIERERERMKKVIKNTYELRELETRLENVQLSLVVGFRGVFREKELREKATYSMKR